MVIIGTMSLASLLSHWRTFPETAPNFATWRTLPARPAELNAFPDNLSPEIVEVLQANGISGLYSHQVVAWQHVRHGENIALATGTASGKTLAYNLPVLETLFEDEAARALYLFPTKALAQDQLSAIDRLLSPLHKSQRTAQRDVQVSIYDGDTPQSHRSAIRAKARLVLTNPDMLHTGILPHHTNWSDFFSHLRFVVIDEMHTYRGVFGSHVANVIRRMKRLARFYGAQPQFILTSATIGNPQELAERLVEAQVFLIDNDGSARGERHFLIYNPPVVEPLLGLRKSILMESVRLSHDLLDNEVQSVMFARSRRSVEIILSYLQANGSQEEAGISSSQAEPALSPVLPIRGYRSGYLPSQRRAIEKGLRDGTTRLVVATNALELGIDIGGLGVAILVGYPGTIASTWQQAGRAGRGDEPSAAVLIASASPLDQFLAHHPDYFFGRSPEQALINPDHLLILLNHLRCAAFELPFQPGEGFGSLPAESIKEFLQFLVTSNELHFSQEKYFWMADAYPAATVSLRSASPENVVLHLEQDGKPRVLGEVDINSAPWLVHPRAIYLHEGQQYYVQELCLEERRANLIPVGLDYYTEPQRQIDIQILTRTGLEEVKGGEKGWGEIQVTTQVVGFKKLRWVTNENLGQELLELPQSEFQTSGYWLSLSQKTVERLRALGAWSNDPNEYGSEWPRLRETVRARDGYRCQACGTLENDRQHDVHHKMPLRAFQIRSEGTTPLQDANRMENLVTLCSACHRKVEQSVRIRSGLAGLGYVMGHIASLSLMCDPRDLGIHTDPSASTLDLPSVIIYEQVPAGIGFSQKLFEIHDTFLADALELVVACPCQDGCPSCVGPGGESGMGGKQETLALLSIVTGKPTD